MTRSEVLELLRATAAEFNVVYGEEVITFAVETPLLGRGARLTSSDLVAFIAEVEYRLVEQFGLENVLTDELAMSQRRSPYRTIGTLADYILSLRGQPNG